MSSLRPPSQHEQLQQAERRRREWWAEKLELPIMIDMILGFGILAVLWIGLTWADIASTRVTALVSGTAAIGGTLLRHWIVRRNPEWLRDPKHSKKVLVRDLPDDER